MEACYTCTPFTPSYRMFWWNSESSSGRDRSLRRTEWRSPSGIRQAPQQRATALTLERGPTQSLIHSIWRTVFPLMA